MTTQTVLQYNGVRLQNVQTLSFVETPIMDDSGVVYLYTKTSLKVVGYFTLDRHETLGVFPAFSDASASVPHGASQQFSALKQHLEMPRRRLVYSTLCNGSTLPPQPGPGVQPDRPTFDPSLGTPIFIIDPPSVDLVDEDDNKIDMKTRTDVHGGPYPKDVNVTHVANNTVWRVEFSVEFATVPPCPYDPNYAPAESVPGETLRAEDWLDSQVQFRPEDIPETLQSEQRKLGILSNRWSCSEQINESGYTSRVYTGKLTLANPHWNPSDFRAITVPPVVPGMVRKSFDYTISEDNLSLRYVVTDQEARITPPKPARTINISHNEANMTRSGVVSFTVRITMTADRKTPLYDILLLAQAIADQRLEVQARVIPNVKTSILIHRREVTTEQASDGTAMLTLVVSGERHAQTNGNVQDALIENSMTMSRSVTWRPVKGTQALLADYNNVLSLGNRNGEQPPTEGGIPAISVLHAKLTTPCTLKFGTESSVSSSEEVTERIRRIDDLEASQPDYDRELMYQAYPDAITIEINDNKAIAPVDNTYSLQHLTFVYSHYNITSSYGQQGLNVALPIARTNTSSAGNGVNALVTIGPRQPTRKIKIEAERVGSPPRLPEPIASFNEEPLVPVYVPGSGDVLVKNTLLKATVHHNNPVPVADGSSLLYTSYLELEYSQDRDPAKHRFGIPDYISPTNSIGSPDSLTDASKYSYSLSSLFVPGALDTTWNT